MNKEKAIKVYFRTIGRKGGLKSRRLLTTEQALAMIKAREDKKRVGTPVKEVTNDGNKKI